MGSTPPPSPSSGPLLPRLLNALLLRRAFYDAVAVDARATGPAGAIVCLAALARESATLYELSQAFRAWGLLLLLVVVFALLRWLIYSAIVYPFARFIGTSTLAFKPLLRCLGFAEAPVVLSMFGFVLDERFLPWVHAAIGAWLLAATIVAVRAATGTTTARATVIGVLGFAAYLLLGFALDVAAQLPSGAPAGSSA